MNTLDVQASLNNLLQMDRHQEETNRTPAGHQVVNADYERDNAARRATRPNEPEQPDGKNVDSEEHKRYQQEMKKRRQQAAGRRKAARGRTDGAGRFCDITV
jgi:hypothetical protein